MRLILFVTPLNPLSSTERLAHSSVSPQAPKGRVPPKDTCLPLLGDSMWLCTRELVGVALGLCFCPPPSHAPFPAPRPALALQLCSLSQAHASPPLSGPPAGTPRRFCSSCSRPHLSEPRGSASWPRRRVPGGTRARCGFCAGCSVVEA